MTDAMRIHHGNVRRNPFTRSAATRANVAGALRRGTHRRAGVATVWVILTVPAIFTMLVFVSDIANLWLARIELGNALEAGALAAAEEWAQGSSTTQARTIAQDYAFANNVIGQPVSLGSNQDLAQGPNDNASCTGDIVLGAVDVLTFTFSAGTAPGPPSTRHFGVKTQKTVVVPSLWTSLFGFTPGPYEVTAHAIAMCPATGTPAQLVHINTFTCP